MMYRDGKWQEVIIIHSLKSIFYPVVIPIPFRFIFGTGRDGMTWHMCLYFFLIQQPNAKEQELHYEFILCLSPTVFGWNAKCLLKIRKKLHFSSFLFSLCSADRLDWRKRNKTRMYVFIGRFLNTTKILCPSSTLGERTRAKAANVAWPGFGFTWLGKNGKRKRTKNRDWNGNAISIAIPILHKASSPHKFSILLY